MTKTANHTPTPWHIGERDPYDNTLTVCAKGRHEFVEVPVAAIRPRPFYANNQEANAAFIVRAVNSHAALVEALTAAVVQMEYTGDGSEAAKYQWPALYDMARAALTLAKGA